MFTKSSRILQDLCGHADNSQFEKYFNGPCAWQPGQDQVRHVLLEIFRRDDGCEMTNWLELNLLRAKKENKKLIWTADSITDWVEYFCEMTDCFYI